MYIELSIWWR